MPRCELGWWGAITAAVRSHLVVILPPDCKRVAGLVQSLEPVFVQALVPELAVETLDVAVLHGLAGLARTGQAVGGRDG